MPLSCLPGGSIKRSSFGPRPAAAVARIFSLVPSKASTSESLNVGLPRFRSGFVVFAGRLDQAILLWPAASRGGGTDLQSCAVKGLYVRKFERRLAADHQQFPAAAPGYHSGHFGAFGNYDYIIQI